MCSTPTSADFTMFPLKLPSTYQVWTSQDKARISTNKCNVKTKKTSVDIHQANKANEKLLGEASSATLHIETIPSTECSHRHTDFCRDKIHRSVGHYDCLAKFSAESMLVNRQGRQLLWAPNQ